MSNNRSREVLYEELKQASDANLLALTILLARRYLADYPDEWPAWLWLGNALTELARYDEAEHALTRVLHLFPEDKRFIPMINLGRLYAARSDFDRAAEWFGKAIVAEPRNASGYIMMGVILARQGRLRDGEEVLRKATETCYEGCLYEAFLNLGTILMAGERFEEAAESIREAIHLNADCEPARQTLRDVERCLEEQRSGHRL
ncbi:MAG: tetratricopeptide repeat protein [Isosphaeraceae bacterium]